MWDIKLISIDEIPKTWRGRMFLIACIIMIFIIAYTIFFNQSWLWIGISACAVAATCIIAFITREERVEEYPKQEAKRVLGRRLGEFKSCWADFKEKHIENKYINLDFRKEMFVCGNTLKKAIEVDEKLLPKTIVDEANNIADTFINLANSLRSRIDKTGMATDSQKQQNYQAVLEEGDRIVRKVKGLKEKLGADDNE